MIQLDKNVLETEFSDMSANLAMKYSNMRTCSVEFFTTAFSFSVLSVSEGSFLFWVSLFGRGL